MFCFYSSGVILWPTYGWSTPAVEVTYSLRVIFLGKRFIILSVPNEGCFVFWHADDILLSATSD